MKILIVVLSSVLGAELMGMYYMVPSAPVAGLDVAMETFVSWLVAAVFGGPIGGFVLGWPLYVIARRSERSSSRRG